MRLSIDDLYRLQRDQAAHTRAAVATKIGGHLAETEIGSGEYLLACEIADVLKRDGEVMVRAALADGLRHCAQAPKELVVELACDVSDDVALPMLRFSLALDDGSLLEIVERTMEITRLLAVAERSELSPELCDGLLAKRLERVTIALVHNEGARISENGYLTVSRNHAGSKAVLQAMMKRVPMPVTAVKLMIVGEPHAPVAAAPEGVASFQPVTDEIVQEDIALLRSLDPGIGVREAQALLDTLNREGRLTSAFMLLALAMGYLTVFVACMAKQTRYNYEEAMQLCSGDAQTFRMLYNKSRISASLFQLFAWTLQSHHEAAAQHRAGSAEFCHEMSDRLLEAQQNNINFAATMGRPIAVALRALPN